MKYFIDTEFIDDGRTIDLISVGIVCEDGREYYAQSCEFNHKVANKWVKEHVLSHLQDCSWTVVTHDTHHPWVNELHAHDTGQCVDQQRGRVHNCPWRTHKQIAQDVRLFINAYLDSEKPELWGWCAGYDFVALCQLFGTMMDLPQGWPHYIREFQQILDDRGISDDDLPKQEEGLHNALADARHLKKLWGYIVRNDAWQ